MRPNKRRKLLRTVTREFENGINHQLENPDRPEPFAEQHIQTVEKLAYEGGRNEVRNAKSKNRAISRYPDELTWALCYARAQRP